MFAIVRRKWDTPNEGKKIPPGWIETGRKNGGCESPCSEADYTARRTELQELLLSFLRFGEENAVRSRYLSGVTALCGKAIRKRIHALRLNGEPIVSGNRGYWLSESRSELRRRACWPDRRGDKIKAAAALKRVSRKAVRA